MHRDFFGSRVSRAGFVPTVAFITNAYLANTAHLRT
jgi:hypothetical protein